MRCLTTRMGLLAAIAVALAGPSSLRADSPFAGNWKVTLVEPGQEATLWLVKVEDKDGKPQVELVSPGIPALKNVTFQDVRLVNAKRLAFTAHARPEGSP